MPRATKFDFVSSLSRRRRHAKIEIFRGTCLCYTRSSAAPKVNESCRSCQDHPPPVAVLSDFAVSPQSNLRYRQKYPSVYALLSVKAVTGTAALGQP
ncbi:putative polygalacturonase [Trifolium repens]|nr:putative polygalacturonase [Trifolium repens]